MPMFRFIAAAAFAFMLGSTLPAMALECRSSEHVQHNLTMGGLDGKLSPYATPRNLSDECAPGNSRAETWVIQDFPGEYANVAEAKAKFDLVRNATRGFTKEEWPAALAFVEKTLKEGTANGRLFVESKP